MMPLRGFLRSNEGIFELSEVTRVGRDVSCDIQLQSLSIELLHAVIERRDSDECYVLQDCNTPHGTYVNDCRVQNGAVNLAHNDIIKFGHGGKPYRLEIEYPRDSESETHCPPISQHSQPRSVRDTSTPLPMSDTNQSLPQLALADRSQSRALTLSPVVSVMPQPPARSRPHTASELRVRSVNVVGAPGERSPSASGLRSQSSSTVHGQRLRAGDGVTVTDSPGENETGQDLELRLLKMGDELSRLSVFESESCRKDGVISSLRDEISQLKHELAVQDETVASVQQDLMSRDAQLHTQSEEIREFKQQSESIGALKVDGSQQRKTIASLTEERNSLKQQLSESKKTNSQLRRDSSEKSSSIATLRAELSQLKMQLQQKQNTKHDQLQAHLQRVKIQLQASERNVQERAHKITVLQGEVDSAREQLEINRETIAQLERKLSQSKSDNRSVQNEVEQLVAKLAQKEEKIVSFCSKVCNVTALANGRELARSETGRGTVLSHVTEMEEQRQSLYSQVEELNEKLAAVEQEESEATESRTSMQHHLKELKDALQIANNRDTTISVLRQCLDSINALEVSEGATWIKEELSERLRFQLESAEELWQITESVNRACDGLEEEMTAGQDTKSKIQIIHQELTNKTQMLREMTARARESDAKHESAVLEAVSQVRSELEAQSARELAAVREEEERKVVTLIEERSTELEKKYGQEMENERHKFELKHEEVHTLEEKLRQKNEELQVLKDELHGVKEDEAALQEKVERLQLQQKTLQHAAVAERNSLEETLRKEIDLYKEQGRQHAFTIVALEEKLLASVAENKELKAGVLSSDKAHHQEQSPSKEQGQDVKPSVRTPITSTIMSTDDNRAKHEIRKLEELVSSLRTQLSAVQREACERTDVAESLRRDLVGMQARMSDLVGELDNEQKREVEQLRLKVAHQEAVLKQREDDIQQLEGITRDQAKTLDCNHHEIGRQQQLLELRLGEAKEQGSELSRLADNVVAERTAKEVVQRQLDEMGQELSEMKMQYQNHERQQQVIERQKETIQQLRDRVRQMEELRPPVPSHEEALRQIVLLKRELNDVKARNKRSQATSTAETSVAVATTAMQTAPPTPVSLREATNTLDRSEKSYLSLLRTLGQSLDLSGMLGSKSVVKLESVEREKVWSDRAKTATAISSQIKGLHERLQRKEKLLEGYEDDLRKLREYEAEKMASGSAVGSLQSELRDKMAEIQLLRESLKRTHEDLDQAQRLNQSLVSRQAFREKHQQLVQSQKRPGHSCMYTEDELQYKIDAQKNATRQVVRKKNYEIEALRRDLYTTQAKLDESRERALQSSAKILQIAGMATS